MKLLLKIMISSGFVNATQRYFDSGLWRQPVASVGRYSTFYGQIDRIALLPAEAKSRALSPY